MKKKQYQSPALEVLAMRTPIMVESSNIQFDPNKKGTLDAKSTKVNFSDLEFKD